MSKLDDILQPRSPLMRLRKQQIKDLMLEIIGEDEEVDNFDDDEYQKERRNDLRTELRQKVEEL